jgi:hypothetical protein
MTARACCESVEFSPAPAMVDQGGEGTKYFGISGRGMTEITFNCVKARSSDRSRWVFSAASAALAAVPQKEGAAGVRSGFNPPFEIAGEHVAGCEAGLGAQDEVG